MSSTWQMTVDVFGNGEDDFFLKSYIHGSFDIKGVRVTQKQRNVVDITHLTLCYIDF